MKIKTKKRTWAQVQNLPRPKHKKPIRPHPLFRTVVRVASIPDLIFARFSYEKVRMEAAGDGPWLILMNHSSFIDLEIASKLLYPKPYNIVCTSDGLVGKEWLMRQIGCIPTQKFVPDLMLIRDMLSAVREKKTSVLMYPEASYSFDGCATPLPRQLGQLLKKLDVPVVMIRTYGAFARDPLYNGLQKRRVKVTAKMECILTREEIAGKSVAELDAVLDEAFTFDNFAWQKENKVKIDAKFRADGLSRILYKCAHCGAETMVGEGITLTCRTCGKVWELDEYGSLRARDGETEFSHIPDWYNWQREQVREAILSGTYRLDVDVDIGVMVDFKAIYMVGEGRLTHDENGFTLTGCDGELSYTQSPKASYGLYSDYFWYEIGDVICIGDRKCLYYCFPKGEGDVVAKTRQAAEELYKICRERT